MCKSSALAVQRNVNDPSFSEKEISRHRNRGPAVLCQTFCPYRPPASPVIRLHPPAISAYGKAVDGGLSLAPASHGSGMKPVGNENQGMGCTSSNETGGRRNGMSA